MHAEIWSSDVIPKQDFVLSAGKSQKPSWKSSKGISSNKTTNCRVRSHQKIESKVKNIKTPGMSNYQNVNGIKSNCTVAARLNMNPRLGGVRFSKDVKATDEAHQIKAMFKVPKCNWKTHAQPRNYCTQCTSKAIEAYWGHGLQSRVCWSMSHIIFWHLANWQTNFLFLCNEFQGAAETTLRISAPQTRI